jgi:acylphosphatase
VGIRRYHLFASGRVQGVGYRYFVQQQAETLALNGWTRNLSDGRVEILVEGEEVVLLSFVEQCQSGPPLSIVTGIALNESAPQYDLSTFSILTSS